MIVWQGVWDVINLLDILIAELLPGDPVVALHVNDVEPLVKLKSGSQGLKEQPQLTELQEIISIFTFSLKIKKKNIIISSFYSLAKSFWQI